MPLPPWQAPEPIHPVGWYLIWTLAALAALTGFYALHPLRPHLTAGARFMRSHPGVWLTLSSIGATRGILQFTPINGGAYGGVDQLPTASNLSSAIIESVGTMARLFYYPVESWPLSILLAIFLLLGWKSSYRRIWHTRTTSGRPIRSTLLGIALLATAAIHLLHQSELLHHWLPRSTALQTAVHGGSRIFQLEVSLCFQAFLFVAIARHFDANPVAKLVDRAGWTLGRAPGLLPLATALFLFEQLARLLSDPSPGIAGTLKTLVVPEFLLLVAPIGYLVTFSRRSTPVIPTALTALSVTLRIWPNYLWFLVFGFTSTALLHTISANIAVSAHGLAAEAWQCLEPVFAITIGAWLLAAWFILLQEENLAVLARNDTLANLER